MQILLVGIGNAALSSRVLVLHQSDGQAAALPIPLPSRRWVARIDYEDGVAVAIMQHLHMLGTYSLPVPIHLSKAQIPGRQGRPTCEYLLTWLQTYFIGAKFTDLFVTPDAVDFYFLAFHESSAACCTCLHILRSSKFASSPLCHLNNFNCNLLTNTIACIVRLWRQLQFWPLVPPVPVPVPPIPVCQYQFTSTVHMDLEGVPSAVCVMIHSTDMSHMQC